MKLGTMGIEGDIPFYCECIVNNIPFIGEVSSLGLLLLEKIYLYIKRSIVCIKTLVEVQSSYTW
jgi:hypothetical protein